MRQWWLSFADRELPKGKQFLGVAIVFASGLGEAIEYCWDMKLNPGGEVMGIELSFFVAPEWCDRLLTKDEAEAVPVP